MLNARALNVKSGNGAFWRYRCITPVTLTVTARASPHLRRAARGLANASIAVVTASHLQRAARGLANASIAAVTASHLQRAARGLANASIAVDACAELIRFSPSAAYVIVPPEHERAR